MGVKAMNPLEDPALHKIFSERVTAVFRKTFGEEQVRIMGGKFDVLRVAESEEGEFVVAELRLTAQVKRSRVLAPSFVPPLAVRGQPA
jgi:hypothetical protein